MNLIEHILTGERRLFFLEGPTGSGKTTLLHRLPPEQTAFLSGETYTVELREFLGTHPGGEPFAPVFLARHPEPILCLEDVDYDLQGKPSTQVAFARDLQALAKERRVVVTGIDLEARCPELFSALAPDQYEFYALV